MKWKVILSNGETVVQDESKPGHWSETVNYCKNNKLTIVQLLYGDQVIEPDANYYFIIFDVVAFPNGQQHIKMGLGAFTEQTGRTRIRWEPVEGKPSCYTEVIHGVPAYFSDLAIKHEGA